MMGGVKGARVKRWAMRIVLALMVGVVVNIGIAWAIECGCVGDTETYVFPAGKELAWPSRTPAGWGSPSVIVEWRSTGQSNLLAARLEQRAPGESLDAMIFQQEVRRAGWPLPALERRRSQASRHDVNAWPVVSMWSDHPVAW